MDPQKEDTYQEGLQVANWNQINKQNLAAMLQRKISTQVPACTVIAL